MLILFIYSLSVSYCKKKKKKEKKGFVAYVGSFSFYFSFGTKIVLSWFTKVINCV